MAEWADCLHFFFTHIEYLPALGCDILYKCSVILSRLVNNSVRLYGFEKKSRSIDIIGLSKSDFRLYLESKFEPWMSWDNYGKIWHIDHIVPCSYFDLTDDEEQRVCFNWRNTQPLFSKDNFSKGNNVLEGSQELVDFICQELNIKKKIILKLRTREE